MISVARPMERRGEIPLALPCSGRATWVSFNSATSRESGSIFNPRGEKLADFLKNAPELRRRREAHGSIRIQEGEPHSSLSLLGLVERRTAISADWLQ
jgi:hypothetical protein